MSELLEYEIKPIGEIGNALLKKGLISLQGVELFLKIMPYGRNSQRENPLCVLEEGRGTCSTKHGLLKLLAEEQGWEKVKLILCIFKMNAANTPKIANVLTMNDLSYLPEAHCYLQNGNEKIDVTNQEADYALIKEAVLYEEEIEVPQLGEYKVQFHQKYLREWIENEGISFSFEEIWKIREACIRALGEG
jgi:hypothetical protein